MKKMQTTVSIGIMAYNEEKNIGNLLDALIKQKLEIVNIEEIIVVSSGSTDRTNEIVKKYQYKYSHIDLIVQKRREGKASAINEFLKRARNEILVLESADTLPLEKTIEKLCAPFLNPQIGMCGARPIPVNNPNSFLGFVAHTLWALHHKMALISPKCGELVAFRKVFSRLPVDTAVDEAWIEHEIVRRGYKIVYIPDAIVYNKGPEKIKDFIRQRRRIAVGHIDLLQRTNYKVSSMKPSILLRLLIQSFPLHPVKSFWFIAALILESYARLLGLYDYYIANKNHAIWEVASSTKNPINKSV